MKKFEKNTDEQLIEMFVSGNNGAVNELLFRYKDRLFRYIYSIVKNRELTEDFFQDTFIKAITILKQNRYVSQGYFLTWLCRIAHNLIVDYFRKEKNAQALSNDEANIDLFSAVAMTEMSIQDEIIKGDTDSELAYLIEQLTDDQRIIIEMRFFQDLSFKEIADNLNIGINTALGRLRYAVQNLRKMAKTLKMLDYQEKEIDRL
jgi:RNA polymerase sigma-70 factor (ECF subfamily)